MLTDLSIRSLLARKNYVFVYFLVYSNILEHSHSTFLIYGAKTSVIIWVNYRKGYELIE